ncbi:MAG: hypothetical protein IT373_06895 [Polyangiaceae bacterium]|nr:hypothetical protein [Polyangiaceae bacterium]
MTAGFTESVVEESRPRLAPVFALATYREGGMARVMCGTTSAPVLLEAT